MVTRVTTPGNYSAVLANLLAAQKRQQEAGNQVATQKNGVNLKEYAGSAEILTSMQSLSTRHSLSAVSTGFLIAVGMAKTVSASTEYARICPLRSTISPRLA